MASSDRLHAKRPIAVVLLSLVVFLGLDNTLFRSGFYSRFESTKSVAGHFASVARWCIGAPPAPPKKDVLVLGHSKIEAAFAPRQFDEENPDSHLRIVMGSSGGTTEKMWFYLLKHIDPNRDRYAGIVIPIDTYKTPPLSTDCDNLIADAQFLTPMLDPKDWPGFAASYTDPKVREKVLLGMAASSHLYAVDLQDFILHPQDRFIDIDWTKKAGPTFLYNWTGFDGDLEELEIDRKAAKILHAPAHLDPFRRLETEARLLPLPADQVAGWTARYHGFREEWLSRIIDFYAGSATKLVFVQVPRWPFDMPALLPLAGAPSLTDFVKPSPNVVVLDEHLFEDLETPYYFYDVLHVNKRARHAFTSRFSKQLRTALGDGP